MSKSLERRVSHLEALQRGDEDLIAVPRWVLRELADVADLHDTSDTTDENCPVCMAAAIARDASEAPRQVFK